MIGLYKRIAAATLVYNKQTIDEYYANDLYEFARPAIGRCILETMGLYDAYKPVEEEIKEETVEELKECPMCGKLYVWENMIWLDGLCTCPECYEKRKNEKRRDLRPGD